MTLKQAAFTALLVALGHSQLFTTAVARADEDTNSPDTTRNAPSRTTPSQNVIDTSKPRIMPVFEAATQLNLSPGIIGIQEVSGTSSTRFTTSAILDWNLSPGTNLSTPMQYGLESGLIYSHIGAPSASFFGTGGTSSTSGIDGNLFIVPLHAWGGYYFRSAGVLLSLQTGADLYLRSDVASMALGRDLNRSGGATDIFTNFGLRLGWDLHQNVGFLLRTEWTLAPNATVFLGMIGAVIPIS